MSLPLNPSVYVGNLDPQVNEQSLYDHFVRIGPVMSVRVCVDAATQKSLGYGYVNFQNPADAEKALDELGAKLLSKHIRVAKIQRDPSQRRSGVNNIVIKRLPAEIDVPSLKEIYDRFGRITSLTIATDEQGKSRGYAYISYEKEDSAVEAVNETNGNEIEGQAIVVERYQPHHREEALKHYTNLYVKNLDHSVTDATFAEYFGKFGKVTSAQVREGFGYVAFEDHDAAVAAIEECNEKADLPIAAAGQSLVVRRFQSRAERKRNVDRLRRERQMQYSKYPNLYVKNFDENVSSDSLKEIFERAGATVSVRVMIDPVTKISRCFGFVSMRDQAAAMKAISELSGSTFLGPRPLFVTYALKRDARRQTLEEIYKKSRRPQGPMGGPMGGMMGGPMGGAGFAPMMPHQGPMFSNNALQGGMPLVRGPMGGMGGPMGGPLAMRNFGMAGPNPMQGGPQGGMPIRRPMQQTPKMPMPMPQPVQQVPPQQQSLPALLANMTPEQQKNILGERLYNYILRRHPNEAAKVTGMLLEMDNSEILNLLDTNELLDGKINEALDVLRRHTAM